MADQPSKSTVAFTDEIQGENGQPARTQVAHSITALEGQMQAAQANARDINEPRPGAGIGALLPRLNNLSDLYVRGKGKTLGDVLRDPRSTWLERVDTEIVDSTEALKQAAQSGR